MTPTTMRLGLSLFFTLLTCSSGHIEHARLMPDPAAIGYQRVPLDTQHHNVPLKVEGKLPSYLNGTLYRGAPGQWPDGWWLDALVTHNSFKFDATSNSVYYSMRYNMDQSYNQTAGHTNSNNPGSTSSEPGTMPHPSNSSWPTGVAYNQVQGKLLTATGVSNQNEIDPDSLAPISLPFIFDDALGAPFLAPTHSATIDGQVLHHLTWGPQANQTWWNHSKEGYTVTSIPKGSRKRQVIAQIESPKDSSWFGKPSYQHQQSVTPDFYVMLEAPCYYPEVSTPVGTVDWVDWGWNPLAGTHVRLIDRKTGESKIWPLSRNLFAIHHINAYHDKATNSVVLDVVQSFPSFLPCSIAFKTLTLNNSINNWQKDASGMQQSAPYRLTMPLDKPGSRVTPKQIGSAKGIEFPTIRYDELNGKPYTFVYGVYFQGKSSAYYDALIKLNVNTGVQTIWSVVGHYVGEPIFVGDPAGTSEDAGVVMTNVIDSTRNQTYLIVLDALTMSEVAKTGPTPFVIPHGYHGRYFNAAVN